MPNTVRLAFVLAFFSILLLFLAPPSSEYLSLLTNDTLPRLRDPSNAKRLHTGIPAQQWVRDWVPLSAAQERRNLSIKTDVGTIGSSLPQLRLGQQWFHLAALFNTWLIVLVMSLIAYVLAMTVARRLTAAPSSILAALLLIVVFSFPAEFSSPNIEGLKQVRYSTDLMMKQVWGMPLTILTAALLASFLPFAGVDPRPTLFQRFMAVLRDTSFFSLTLLSLLFYLHAVQLQGTEREIESATSKSSMINRKGLQPP